jgi:signal peptidase I
MYPTLQVFDFVYVKNVTGLAEVHASYDDGDIVLMRVPSGEFIVHRAVEKYQQDSTWYFKGKGDNNTAADAWAPKTL